MFLSHGSPCMYMYMRRSMCLLKTTTHSTNRRLILTAVSQSVAHFSMLANIHAYMYTMADSLAYVTVHIGTYSRCVKVGLVLKFIYTQNTHTLSHIHTLYTFPNTHTHGHVVKLPLKSRFPRKVKKAGIDISVWVPSLPPSLGLAHKCVLIGHTHTLNHSLFANPVKEF